MFTDRRESLQKWKQGRQKQKGAEQAAHAPVQLKFRRADQVTHIQASIHQCKTQTDSFSYQITEKTL